jgi:hypothetical protein
VRVRLFLCATSSYPFLQNAYRHASIFWNKCGLGKLFGRILPSWVLSVRCSLIDAFVERVLPMFRTVLGVSSVAILLAATGCTMCSHPFDNSGPVYSQDECQSSGHARAGSVLDKNPQPSESLEQTQTEEKPTSLVSARPKMQGHSVSSDTAGGRVHAKVTEKTNAGDVPGSERIVSVSEQVVKPAADSPQVAEESPSDSSQPLPSTGWTARRPTPEVLR